MHDKTFRTVNEATVFTLPWEVAIREGLFRAAGLEVEVVPKNSANTAFDILKRDKEASFNGARLDCYDACEWGVIKRVGLEQHRPAKIVRMRESITAMAIVAHKDASHVLPDDLAGVPVGIQHATGSHYMTLKLLEGFLRRGEIEPVHVGGPALRLRALLDRQVEAATLMEPFLSCALAQGHRLIVQSFYNGLVAVPEDYDPALLRRIYAELDRAVDLINADVGNYAGMLLADLPDELRAGMSVVDLRLDNLRYIHARPYSRERYRREAAWMADWGMLEEGAKPELVVA